MSFKVLLSILLLFIQLYYHDSQILVSSFYESIQKMAYEVKLKKDVIIQDVQHV